MEKFLVSQLEQSHLSGMSTLVGNIQVQNENPSF